MDTKLQELTDKLFQEGIVKGNIEAEKIISEAQARAQAIIDEANTIAEDITATAEKKAAELDRNTKTDLKLAADQLIAKVKNDIVNLISANIVTSTVKPALSDTEFVQKLIVTAVENWAKDQSIVALVPESELKNVEQFFNSKAKKALDSGLKVESSSVIKSGFQIAPADGSYKVSFTDEDFVNFFKEFLRPRVINLLFDAK